MTFDLASPEICISVDNSVGNVVVSGSNRWKSLDSKRWTRGFKTPEWCGWRTIITAVYFRDTRIPQEQIWGANLPSRCRSSRAGPHSVRHNPEPRGPDSPNRITEQDYPTRCTQEHVAPAIGHPECGLNRPSNPINPHKSAETNQPARSSTEKFNSQIARSAKLARQR